MNRLQVRHWVRVTTACNNRCLFCLDADTPRDLVIPVTELEREIDRGRQEQAAERLILSGGEATLHPSFVELVRYARRQGYDRVQVITNGHRFADRAFFEACMAAGLGEITFSLHGADAALHDRLTGRPGAFKGLMKGLVRALRDGRPIVNVDVVINRQNVAVVPKILELCISLGVSEFDLLHLIPQGRAYENREALFYDLGEHLSVLQEVFRLSRHPRLTLWTNRFPVAYLEGLEDLIQAPHKLLDEVNGRRFQIRRYLDTGQPLDCRSPDRCRHCFVEPFCTTMDRVIAAQHRRDVEVWWTGDAPWGNQPLPFGCRTLGVAVDSCEALSLLSTPAGVGLYAAVGQAGRLAEGLGNRRELTLIAWEPEQLDRWLTGDLPDGAELEIRLNRRTAAWLLSHRDRLRETLAALRVHQPAHDQLATCVVEDVPDPAAFFHELALPIPVSGLPACLAPGTLLVAERRVLPRRLFDPETGRLSIVELVAHHIATAYRAKSLRCASCPVFDRCEGAHINQLRHLGFSALQPLGSGPATEQAAQQLRASWPAPPARLATGRQPEAPAPSLPGYGAPEPPPLDPLAISAAKASEDSEAPPNISPAISTDSSTDPWRT